MRKFLAVAAVAAIVACDNSQFTAPTSDGSLDAGREWDDDAPALRSAARQGSSEDWKEQDPQIPQSIWYHTDARWLGFRIVRPLKVPTADEMYFYWNSATGKR